MRIVALVCAASVFLVAAPSPAAAHAYVGYGIGPTYYNTTVVVPTNMTVRNQVYDFTVSGVLELCEALPDLCELPEQQSMLSTLSTERIVGWSLVGVGSLAILGSLLFVIVPVSRSDCRGLARLDNAACDINHAAMWSVLGGGLALSIAGYAVLPNRRELQRFINKTNATHSDVIQLQLGSVAPQAPGMQLALQF